MGQPIRVASALAHAVSLLAVPPTTAEERATIGMGRLFTNDFFGDGNDRWRTGSYTLSLVRGPEWQGDLPTRPGAVLEYRLRSEIIAPRSSGGQLDRPYAGVVAAGVFTHFSVGESDVTLGAEVLALGPQTGVSDFQIAYHDFLGLPAPVGPDSQLEDAIHLGGVAEVRRTVAFSETFSVRPFVEAQVGIEDMARIGVDALWGPVGQTDLWLRDPVTGHLYRATADPADGIIGLAFGGDWASVGGSVFLPDERGVEPEGSRYRLRAGLHTQVGEATWFYGLTYHGPEFVGQDDGQLTGSLKVNFNF